MYKVPLPFTIGRDGAGVIEEIVENDSNPIKHDLKVGDRVCYAPTGTSIIQSQLTLIR